MEQEQELFGKLFETIPLYNYSLGECEVISKAIRTTTKKEKETE